MLYGWQSLVILLELGIPHGPFPNCHLVFYQRKTFNNIAQVQACATKPAFDSGRIEFQIHKFVGSLHLSVWVSSLSCDIQGLRPPTMWVPPNCTSSYCAECRRRAEWQHRYQEKLNNHGPGSEEWCPPQAPAFLLMKESVALKCWRYLFTRSPWIRRSPPLFESWNSLHQHPLPSLFRVSSSAANKPHSTHSLNPEASGSLLGKDSPTKTTLRTGRAAPCPDLPSCSVSERESVSERSRRLSLNPEIQGAPDP